MNASLMSTVLHFSMCTGTTWGRQMKFPLNLYALLSHKEVFGKSCIWSSLGTCPSEMVIPQRRQTVYPLRLKLMTWCWSLWLVEGWASLTLATLLSVYQTFFFIYVVLLRLTWDLYRSVHPGRHHNRIMNGTKLSMYLQLKVLAAVVPLKQDAPLASAFTELLDSTLVFLHLFNHLRSQLHHWLVMSDGQQENMVGGETSLSQSHVTLEID